MFEKLSFKKSSEAPQSSTDAVVPQIVSRRKKITIIISAIIVLLVLIAGSITVAFFLRRTSEPKAQPVSSALPSTTAKAIAPIESAQPLETAISEIITESPQLTPSPLLPQKNVLIKLRYEIKDRFTVDITEASETDIPRNSIYFRPQDGAPYSVVRIEGEGGEILAEDQVSFSTSFWGEVGDEETEPQAVGVTEGAEDIVMSIPAESTPIKAVVLSSQGAVLDELEIVPGAGSSEENSVLGVSDAGRKFVIAVINELGANGTPRAIHNGALSPMVAQIKPWSDFQDKIKIVEVDNPNVSLGCKMAQLNFPVPFCQNSSAVMNAVSKKVPDWNLIVVVLSATGKTGSVASGFPPIIAVTSDANAGLIAHEAGHATGKMTDEYTYKYANSAVDGPNCFPSENACKDAIESYPPGIDAKCALGCNNKQNWRPATRIMHCTYKPEPMSYGSLEECIMKKAIGSVLGTKVTCSGPDPSKAPTNEYWGWHR